MSACDDSIFNAPQYIDFTKMNDEADEGIDKFFDVDYDLHPHPSAAQHEASASIGMQEIEDKENNIPETPQIAGANSARKSTKRRASRVLDNQQSGDTSTYMTPGTSRRKSQAAFMNGHLVLLQNYEGITLVTPNKVHPMETRLDIVIKSPTLSLRSRAVQKNEEIINGAMKAEKVDTPRKSKRTPFKELKLVLPEQIELPEIDRDAEVELEEETVSVPEVPEQVMKPKPQPLVAVARSRRVNPLVPMRAMRPVALPVSAPGSAKRKFSDDSESQLPRAKVFKSAAELVLRFQKGTPERFHSKPATSKLQLEKNAGYNFHTRQNTIPKSPFLSTKQRQNLRFEEHIPTQKEREEEELEEIKKHQVKANPLNRRVLAYVPPKHVFSKTPTKPQPFNLSQGKRKEPTPEPVFQFKATKIAPGVLSSPKLPPRQELPVTKPHTPNLRITAKYPKRVRVETPDHKDKEVGHFGMKGSGANSTPNRVTQVQPFSFEQRDRLMQQRREKLLKKQIEEEAQLRNFKAQKKPSFRRSPVLPQRQLLPVTVPHTPQLSAKTIGQQNLAKFKKMVENEEAKQRADAQFHAREAKVVKKAPFQPTLPNRVLTEVQAFQLNTERRAAERARFDEMLRLKEIEFAEHKAQLDALREEEEREAAALQRKQAEFVANPIRLPASPMIPHSSNKSLTVPQSPGLQALNRSRALK